MTGFFTEVRETLIPPRSGKDGPLPVLLVALTFITGLTDAFSYLVLGHVFVANMTGNVVFIAFALAGERGFSVTSSLVALGAFAVGSFIGGRRGSRSRGDRGRLLWTAAGIQAACFGIGIGVAVLAGDPVPVDYSYVLISALAVSLGLQNATARKLAVPDLTTTVLTLTITGLVADSKVAGGPGSKAGRRLTSVFVMFLGALTGVLCILHVYFAFPIVISFLVAAAVSLVTWMLSRKRPAWSSSP